MFNSILVVCVGNICRSPTGERLLRNFLSEKNIKVDSAGLAALVDKPADRSAKSIALEHGVDLSGHIARQLTATICREYDLILVMEKKHIEEVAKIAPEVHGKTMLFGYWLNQSEIPDPYKRSNEAFESVFNLLEDAAQKWVKALNV